MTYCRKDKNKNLHARNMRESDKQRFTNILFKRYAEGSASSKERKAMKRLDADIFHKQNSDIKDQIIKNADNRQRKLLSEKLGFDISYSPQVKIRTLPFIVYGGIAAAIIVSFVLILPGLLNINENKEILVTNSNLCEYQSTNNIKTITLPDGSVVKLNRETTLKIKEKAFNKKDREIWLQGEAFFDVAKNPDKPFIIHSGQLTTTVLGTSFNMCAYNGLPFMKISVREGKVRVNDKNSTLDILTANKQLNFEEKSGTYETIDKVWNDASEWTSGKLVLDGAGVDELKIRIKQFYGAKLVFKTSKLNDMRFSAIFPAECKVNHLLDMISELYNVTYTIQDKTITISE